MAPPVPLKGLSRPHRWPLAIVALIAACMVPELILQGADHGLWGSARWRPMTYAYGAFWAGLLHGWTPNYLLQPMAMFATHAFLHADALHLAVNMVTLLSFGRAIIARVGTRRFLWLYATSVIGGGIGFALLTNSPRPMVGASGALFGLVGAWIVWEFEDAWTEARGLGNRLVLVGQGLVMPTVVLIALNVAMYVSTGGVLAWETHLGGFIAGALAAPLLMRQPGTS
jgi:membrane associated rhomboid family serine protease